MRKLCQLRSATSTLPLSAIRDPSSVAVNASHFVANSFDARVPTNFARQIDCTFAAGWSERRKKTYRNRTHKKLPSRTFGFACRNGGMENKMKKAKIARKKLCRLQGVGITFSFFFYYCVCTFVPLLHVVRDECRTHAPLRDGYVCVCEYVHVRVGKQI